MMDTIQFSSWTESESEVNVKEQPEVNFCFYKNQN